MSSLLGSQLKQNMSMGLPTRNKSVADYIGCAMRPCGDYADSEKGPSHKRSPWLRGNEDLPNLSLHDEIAKFMLYIQPTKQEISVRDDLVDRFTRLIASFKTSATVHPVGSYVTGFFLPTSDIDMVLIFDKDRGPSSASIFPSSARMVLSSILHKLQGTGFASKVENVLQATVPLIRITDKKTGIEIDLTAADTHGIKATKAVQKWTDGEDAEIIKMLVTVVKMFLSIRRCGTTYTGGLNSYVLVWLVVAWVHLEWKGNKPQSSAVPDYNRALNERQERQDAAFNRMFLEFQTINLDSSQRLPQKPITSTPVRAVSQRNPPPTDFGEILLRFFQFYGCQFDYYTRAISIEPHPAYVEKIIPYSRYVTQRYLLAISDPADNYVDMGSKAYGIKNVQESFKEAYSILSKAKRQYGRLVRLGKTRGLLGYVLGGDFTNFDRKRAAILRA
ncbi:hypothetical protein HYPSUDRAFT_47003 [Hypholoma sublateritium FD-334 SS-4]|uniref:polynucleotide adenylyltransferase n=1 Tax=Hypholoma sublateritium (strain FD-334 SS-4) TaxID=945553 RepID=A0A0D2NCB0_HYPSF|nr:hypothetical protein HYPSUDRAFT_47003 [Hypholoma sublateritium FD-334 SS-4]